MPTDPNADRRRLTRQVRILTLGSSGMAAAATVALTVMIAGHHDAAPSGSNAVTGTTRSATTGSADGSTGGGITDGSTAQDQGIVVTPAPQPGGRGNAHAGSGGS